MTGTAEGVAPPASAEQSPGQQAAELPVRPGVIIGMLVVAAFVMILNETILSVALQHLTVDLGVDATTVQWLTSGFLLTMAVVIPTTGYLLQRLTPRQVFLLAMSLFSAGTLISGVAPGFTVLLVGRVVQAAGTAVMIPLLMTTVMTLIPVERRGSMMGNLSIVIAVAPAVGPTVGGFVLANFGWRWMFLSVLPLALAVLVLGALFMKLSSQTRSVPLDLLSVLLTVVAFGGIVYGFATIGEGGGGGEGGGLPPWIPLVVGSVGLALFVWRQLALQRADRALLDLRPFTHPQFSLAVALAALVFMSLLGAGAILLPLFLQTVLAVGPDTVGLAVLPGGLLLAAMGRPVGMIFDRFGPRPLVIPGAVALAVSMWLLSFLGSGPLAAVIGAHVLLMVGLGLMMTPLLTASLGVLPPHLYSHGSAIMTTLQQVAGAASTAGLVTIATLASTAPSGTPDAGGLRVAFSVAGAIGVLAVIISLFVTGRSADGAVASGPHGEVPVDPAADERPAPAHAARHATVDEPAAGGVATTLHGRISTGGGAVAVVTLIDANGAQHGRARTAADGGYELAVPAAGVWNVVVSAPEHRPKADRLVVTHGGVVTHDVVLPAVGTPQGGTTDTRPFASVSTS